MRIRTQLVMTLLLFGIVMAAIWASAIVTSQQVGVATDQLTLASKVAQGANELGYLSNEYLIYRESQQLSRWQSKFVSFSTDVASLSVDKPEQQVLVRNIRANQQRMGEVFESIVSTAGGSSPSSAEALDPTFLQVSWSRMAVQSQGLNSDASRLAQLLRNQVDEARQTNLVFILAMAGVFGAYFLVNYYIVQRRLLQSIAELRAGTLVIGSGNLGFLIEERRNDEIGELSRAFNEMTGNLKLVTASKSDLEREISERKKAEAERERLLAAEQEARELAEKAVRARDEFISIAAHELKTPITSLRGFAQLLARTYERGDRLDPARLAKAMTTIDHQSRRLARLTDQLLNLSRLEAGRFTITPEETNLATLVATIVDEMRHSHPQRNINLTHEGQATAAVDPLRFSQVVVNLLDNALKFSPADTSVDVDLRAEDGHARLQVRDRGRGIPPDRREHIFERFYQAHDERHYGGMGIGLYISQQIMQLHGGEIEVECPENGGSSFVARLPLNGQAATVAEEGAD